MLHPPVFARITSYNVCYTKLYDLNVFSVGERDATHLAFFNLQAGNAALKADFAAEGDDLGSHPLDHADEAEGADVRMREVKDFLRRAGLDELGQHLAPEEARVLDLAVELAVGKP